MKPLRGLEEMGSQSGGIRFRGTEMEEKWMGSEDRCIEEQVTIHGVADETMIIFKEGKREVGLAA